MTALAFAGLGLIVSQAPIQEQAPAGALATKSGGGRSGKGKGQPPPGPHNFTELSEKDVLNVLKLVRKEFNVDDTERS